MLNKDNLKKALEEMNPSSKKFNFFKYDDKIINGKHAVDWYINNATRSNGKTTAVQRDVILERLLKGEKSVIVKKRKEFLKNQYNVSWWTEIVKQKLRKYDIHIEYKTGVYYINEYEVFIDDEGVFDKKEFMKSATKFAYVIPLLQEEQYKSVIETENVTSIIYDEFASVSGSAPQEPERMKSLISTIVRTTGHVQVFLNANIVQPHNPFFKEFGINAFDLREGEHYTFLADTSNKNSAVIYVDFSKGVAKDSSDLPRVLQLKDNTQALGQDKFNKPLNVLDSNDWLLYVLENAKSDFNKFYEIQNECRVSIDDSKYLRTVGSEYQFEYIEFYIIYDLINDKYYFIDKSDSKLDEGLAIFTNKDYEKVKLNDNDIRNDLPIIRQKNYGNVTYGSVGLYTNLRELE